MRATRLIVLLLAVTGLMFTAACSEEQATENAQVDLADESQRVGYAVGMQMADNYLKGNYEGLDKDMVVQGFADVVGGKETVFSSEDKSQIINAWNTERQSKAKEKLVAERRENKKASEKFLNENAEDSDVIVLDSGVQYKILEPGEGRTPNPDDTVTMEYRGTLVDGREFDSTYARNQAAVFPVAEVIPGLRDVVTLMKEGARWKVFIPPTLGYGEQGTKLVPPNSVLVFDLELISVSNPEKEAEARTAAAQHNRKQAEEFLEKNAKRPEVKTTESGLQYEVLKQGDGPHPEFDDVVLVHYRGTLPDGTEFGSSLNREEPVAMTVKGVMPGWTEAMMLAKVGGKYKFYIKPDLAYGDKQYSERIPPGSALIFEVDVLGIAEKKQESVDPKIRAEAEKNKHEGRQFLARNKQKPGVTELPTGVQYKIVKPGEGPSPRIIDDVKMHYKGTLIDGFEFDNTYNEGAPKQLSLRGVIPGVAEVLQRMHKGGKWIAYIPSDYAYGDKEEGPIPPGSTLIVELELVEVIPKDEQDIPEEAKLKPITQ